MRQAVEPLQSSKPAVRDHRTPRWPPEKGRLRGRLEDAGMRAASWIGVGLDRALGSRAGSATGILTYHRIAPHVPGLPAPLHNVTPARFHAQLSGLIARGFTPWPLRRLLDHRAHGEVVPPRVLIVTFDDGFQSVYTRAWPILRALQVPATVFVNTAYLDSDQPFPFDAWGVAHASWAPPDAYRPLTFGQCDEMMADGLVEIGAHTHTHQDFRGWPDAFRADLQRSVDIVRRRFVVGEVSFAFPYGSPQAGFAGADLKAAARATGVRCGLTTEAVLVDVAGDPFAWGRMNAFAWDTAATLAAKLDGWYSWAPKLRRWLSGPGDQAPFSGPDRTPRTIDEGVAQPLQTTRSR